MKKLLAALAGVSVLAVCAPAMAASYGGIGYSKVDADDASLGAVTARVGWQSESVFGVEAEASVGTKDDTVGTSTFELKHNIAVFGVVRAPVGEGFSVHARLGYGSAKIDERIGATTFKYSESGVAYGVGGQYNWGANGARLDLTRQDFDGTDVDAITVSYVRGF